MKFRADRYLYRMAAALLVVGSSIRCAGVTSVAPPQPEISVTVRGLIEGSIEVGTPAGIAVRIDSPADPTTELALAPARGSWIEATTIDLLRAGGGMPLAQARSVSSSADARVVVSAEEPALGLWWFPAEAMSALAPGDYVVQARLKIHDGTGWQGEVGSESTPIRIVPVSDDPARLTQRALARAHAAILESALERAAEILDARLRIVPDDIAVLALRAAVCLGGDNAGAARACVNRARVLQAAISDEPSVELEELAVQIDQKLAEVSTPTTSPTWTAPPSRVLEPVRPKTTAAPLVGRAGEKPKEPIAELAPSLAGTALVDKDSKNELHEASTAIAAKIEVAASAGIVLPATELSDATIAADSSGQWASAATAGSQYGKTQYSPKKALGAPDIAMAGNSPDAWCPASKNEGTDWLELTFAKPVHATEIRVRQNDAVGAIAKVEAIESDGTTHVWWEGVDPYVAPAARDIAWFAVRVPKTDYLVAKVKLTLNLATVPGWK